MLIMYALYETWNVLESLCILTKKQRTNACKCTLNFTRLFGTFERLPFNTNSIDMHLYKVCPFWYFWNDNFLVRKMCEITVLVNHICCHRHAAQNHFQYMYWYLQLLASNGKTSCRCDRSGVWTFVYLYPSYYRSSDVGMELCICTQLMRLLSDYTSQHSQFWHIMAVPGKQETRPTHRTQLHRFRGGLRRLWYPNRRVLCLSKRWKRMRIGR